MTEAMLDILGDDLSWGWDDATPGPAAVRASPPRGAWEDLGREERDACWRRLRDLQADLPPGYALLDYPLEEGHRWRLLHGLQIVAEGTLGDLTPKMTSEALSRLQARLEEPAADCPPQVSPLGLRRPGYFVLDNTRGGQLKVVAPDLTIIGRTKRWSTATRGGASEQRRVTIDGAIREAQEDIAAEHMARCRQDAAEAGREARRQGRSRAVPQAWVDLHQARIWAAAYDRPELDLEALVQVVVEAEGYRAGREGLGRGRPSPLWDDRDRDAVWREGWQRGLRDLQLAELAPGHRLEMIGLAWAVIDGEGRNRGWGHSPQDALKAQVPAVRPASLEVWWDGMPVAARYAYVSEAFPDRVLEGVGLSRKAWRKLPPADQARLLRAAEDLDEEHGTRFAPTSS